MTAFDCKNTIIFHLNLKKSRKTAQQEPPTPPLHPAMGNRLPPPRKEGVPA